MNKLTKFLSLTALLLLTAAIFAGCGGSTTTTNATNKPADNKTVVTENKTTTTTETNKTTVSTGGEIGVPECDEYIKKYEACVMNKVPEAQRSVFKSSLDQMRSSWKQAASSPQAKSALAGGCKTALETAKQSLASYSCEW